MRLATLALVVLGALPVLIAAPVPPGALEASFGADGLLSRADLEKVGFASRIVADRRVENLEAFRASMDRLRSTADLAVHMPRTTFRSGESIPVYFVMKNRENMPTGLSSRLDLSYGRRAIWNDFAIHLRDCKTAREVPLSLVGDCMLGGPPRIVIPPKGFYAMRGEFGMLSAGKALPASEYEISWSHWQLQSAGVPFTVIEAETKESPAASEKPIDVRFYYLAPQSGLNREDCRLERVATARMASALAVGIGDRYVPDIRTIPATDGVIRVSAKWTSTADSEVVTVALRAADERKPVAFDLIPRFHLQVELETALPDDGIARLAERAKDAMHTASLRTPLTIDLRLPKNWRKSPELTGNCRVAVLVTSKEVELPERPGLERVKEEKILRLPGSPPTWSGVLRTEFIDLASLK